MTLFVKPLEERWSFWKRLFEMTDRVGDLDE